MAPGAGKAPVVSRENPPFTLADIRNAIPAHLFERSTFWSFVHLAINIAEFFVAFAFAYYVCLQLRSPYLAVGAWIFYALWQGAVMTGLWVIAHECGHEAFSDYQIVNDSVGFVLHTMLLVPFYSWKFSHSKHHHYTNHMTKDEPFVPERKVEGGPDVVTPLGPVKNGIFATTMVTIGWYLYLTVNMSGPQYENKPLVSHFDPNAPIFKKRDYAKVVASIAGLVGWLATLYYVGTLVGFANVALFYGLPMLIVNWWLTSITYLQHTDVSVPHYDDEDWTWLRGALCTVDRSLGPYLNWRLHYINNSHVVHHMFSTMPFYNAIQATPYVKAVLGEYYCDETETGLIGYLTAFWYTHAHCHTVEGDGVLFWTPTTDQVSSKQD